MIYELYRWIDLHDRITPRLWLCRAKMFWLAMKLKRLEKR